MFETFRTLYKDIKTALDEKENIRLGEEWEKEVREHFFEAEDYDIIAKTHSFEENRKDFVKSSLDPDYKLQCKLTSREFYVECKARDVTKFLKKLEPIDREFEKYKKDRVATRDLEQKHKYVELFDICNEDQFQRYKALNKAHKVLFMVVFFHASEKEFPETICLVPIDDLLTNRVFFGQLLEYAIPPLAISPFKLWRHFVLFYGSEGHCVRCNSRIKFNNLNPLCHSCWENWFTYKKFTYPERYCHSCGQEAAVSSIKPLCNKCYKFPMNYGL